MISDAAGGWTMRVKMMLPWAAIVAVLTGGAARAETVPWTCSANGVVCAGEFVDTQGEYRYTFTGICGYALDYKGCAGPSTYEDSSWTESYVDVFVDGPQHAGVFAYDVVRKNGTFAGKGACAETAQGGPHQFTCLRLERTGNQQQIVVESTHAGECRALDTNGIREC
jgi:hypothetical protein